MKKRSSAVLAMVLVFALACGAFAAESTIVLRGEKTDVVAQRIDDVNYVTGEEAQFLFSDVDIEAETVALREEAEKQGYTISWSDALETVVLGEADASLKAGYYTITLAGTDRALCVTDDSVERAARLAVRDADEAATKSWRLKKFGTRFSMLNEETHFAADVNSASTQPGVSIIQWTPNAGRNQQWEFTKNTDGTYFVFSVLSGLLLTETDGLLTQEEYDPSRNQRWDLTFVSEYVSILDTAMASQAFATWDSELQTIWKNYLLSDFDMSMILADKAETLLLEGDFANQDLAAQQALLRDCLDLTAYDLYGGSMYTKLKADVTITSVEKKEKQNIWGDEEIDAWDYTVRILDDTDDYTFHVISSDEHDEEYALRVGESVACFEVPIRHTLRNFFYSGQAAGTWNGGGGQIWNNTAYKGDVNNMVQMFAHELGHVIDNGTIGTNDIWYRAIARDLVPITGYGNSNRWEDFAEFSRMYLLARGDEARIRTIETIWPNRTQAYRATLYVTDPTYYAQYKAEYDAVAAPLADMTGFDFGQYYTLTYGDQALAMVDGVPALTAASADAATVPEAQQWQVLDLSSGLVQLLNRATGSGFYLPVEPEEEVEEATEAATEAGEPGEGVSMKKVEEPGEEPTKAPKETTPTAMNLALKKAEDGTYQLVSSYSSFAVSLDANGAFCEVRSGEGVQWTLTAVTPIPNMGLYTIALDGTDRYLSAERAERGAQLTLSEEPTQWYLHTIGNQICYLTYEDTDLAVDISGNSVEVGGHAILWTVSRDPNQRFHMSEAGGKTMMFAIHSELPLGVKDGVVAQGDQTYQTAWILQPVE